jgi:hypothetical protein
MLLLEQALGSYNHNAVASRRFSPTRSVLTQSTYALHSTAPQSSEVQKAAWKGQLVNEPLADLNDASWANGALFATRIASTAQRTNSLQHNSEYLIVCSTDIRRFCDGVHEGGV